MKNILNKDNFIIEKRIQIKKRFTEANSMNISTFAKVRTTLINAIADGHLTETEVLKILSDINANKKWINKNISLFNVSEDQNGVKMYSLSPFGQRIRNATIRIDEGLNVPYKEQGKQPVNIFVGRFQPFTLGHVKVFEQMHKKNGYPVVVYLVRGPKKDLDKTPFDEELQQAMFAAMTKQYTFLEASFIVHNAAIDTLFAAARPAYEPVLWGYGTDRKKAYNYMINKAEYREELNVDPLFTGFEIFRTDDDISASKVRKALSIDDETSFKAMTPKSIHSFYKTLQDNLQYVKEHVEIYNMKNLKSIYEFNALD